MTKKSILASIAKVRRHQDAVTAAKTQTVLGRAFQKLWRANMELEEKLDRYDPMEEVRHGRRPKR